MGEVTTYNPDEVTVIWGDYTITGFADETAIEAAYNEDHVSVKNGIKGDTMYTVNGNRSGNVKLVLFETSSSLAVLRADALALAKKTLMIRNAGSDGGYLIVGEKCRILKAPGISHGKDGSTKEINIHVPDLKIEQ